MTTPVNIMNSLKHATSLVTPTPKPSPDDIQNAAPMRAAARQNIVNLYNNYQNEIPIYYKAGLTYWQVRPMNDFLNIEMVWWNNNVELGIQQVTTRQTYDNEHIADLKKELEKNLTVVLNSLPADQSKAIIESLATANSTLSTSTGAKPSDTTSSQNTGSTAPGIQTATVTNAGTVVPNTISNPATGQPLINPLTGQPMANPLATVAASSTAPSLFSLGSTMNALKPGSTTQGFIDINISDASGSKFTTPNIVTPLTDVLGLTAPSPTNYKVPEPSPTAASPPTTTLNLDTVNKNISKDLTPSQIAQNQLMQQKINNTWWNDLSAAFKTASGIFYTVLHIGLGLRLAGFVANDLLYKPLGYRIIAFLYVFVFLPILIPYYIYREIRYWFYPNDMENAPKFESIFPMKPYDPSLPLSFSRRLYGYADTPGINAWMSLMREKEKKARIKALSGDSIYEKLTGE